MDCRVAVAPCNDGDDPQAAIFTKLSCGMAIKFATMILMTISDKSLTDIVDTTPGTMVTERVYVAAQPVLRHQLAAIEASFAAIQQPVRHGLQLDKRRTAWFGSLAAPTQPPNDAWSWFTDFVANKCLIINYFLSGQPFPSNQIIDELADNPAEARLKATAVAAYRAGLHPVPELVSYQTREVMPLFDAVEQFLSHCPSRAAADVPDAQREQARTELQQLRHLVSALAGTLGDIQAEHLCSWREHAIS